MDGQSEAIIDLGAIRSNLARMADYVRPAQVMAVVKSDGYGHGAVRTATAAVAGGATWLGVGHISEALELRAAGLTIPVLCLMAAPEGRYRHEPRRRADGAVASGARRGARGASSGAVRNHWHLVTSGVCRHS